ncbi:hypothetical protein SUNI508_05821 [Seiridium unicorne]|uniref:Uncharacterized protein n=1 Tax=Seiridium unicorne TaxID=138068 RepID=A0ABR2V306_9PEZI
MGALVRTGERNYAIQIVTDWRDTEERNKVDRYAEFEDEMIVDFLLKDYLSVRFQVPEGQNFPILGPQWISRLGDRTTTVHGVNMAQPSCPLPRPHKPSTLVQYTVKLLEELLHKVMNNKTSGRYQYTWLAVKILANMK